MRYFWPTSGNCNPFLAPPAPNLEKIQVGLRFWPTSGNRNPLFGALERVQVGLRFWPASGNCDPPFGAPSTKFGEGAGWIAFLAYQWQL